MAVIVAPPAHARGRLTGIIGRARERAVLRDELAAVLGGNGRFVLIAGQAGSGKTTLVEALGHEAAAQGALVLTGRCYDLTETPPYGPWCELACAYPPSIDDFPRVPAVLARGGGAAESASPDAHFLEMRGFLAEAVDRCPVVLILEDLHWFDRASLDLLRRLAREVDRLRLLIITTYRGEEVRRPHPLFTILPLLISEARAIRLELRPLDDADVRALVRGRYMLPANDLDRLVAYLQARAEGSPFFLTELLRGLDDERVLRPVWSYDECTEGREHWELGDVSEVGLPVLLRQVLDRQLSCLADDERGLLAIGAIIGREVELTLWAAVGLIEPEVLLQVVERGVEAHVLEARADGGAVRFAHALVREALYEGLLPPRRRVWHRRVAEVLLALPQPDLDAVAHHFRQAADPRAIEWLARAGEQAQNNRDWLTAADRYEAALALLDGPGADTLECARILIALAHVRSYTDTERALGCLEAAERLAATASDHSLAAVAQFDRGHLQSLTGDRERGIVELRAGLARLETLPPAEHARLSTLTILGIESDKRTQRCHREVLHSVLTALGHLDEARAMDPTAASYAEGATFRESLGQGLLHATLGHPDQARRALTGARMACADHHGALAKALFWELALVALPYETDRLAERQRLAHEAETELARAGVPADASPHLLRLPLMALEGRWTEARDLALAGHAVTRMSEWDGRYPSIILGQLAHAQGDTDLVWQMVREELPAGPATAPGSAWLLPALAMQRLAADLAIDSGDLAGARSWLAAHDAWLAWSGASLGRAEGQLGWAAYHRAAGDLALARQRATQALEYASWPRQPLALLTAHRVLGEVATVAGHWTEATTHLDAALSLVDACAAPYERALTLLSLAGLRRAIRDRDAVGPLLTEVRTICMPLGARRALKRADALAPERAPLPPGGYPAGLTVREVEVLSLIAGGASNREVAEELILSVRTVERHMNNIYRKIDARGRADAVAYAARHSLLTA
jgi:DNA-binding CsgD family transcriptional regulator